MDPRERWLDELVSLREIEQVILGLARATDRRDAEAIRACYHADAFDDHGAFQGGPTEFAEWVPKALAPFAATQHVVGPPRIELEGDVAHCETYCTAHHVTGPDDPSGARDAVMGLRYVDRFERRAPAPDLPPPPASARELPGGPSRRPTPPASAGELPGGPSRRPTPPASARELPGGPSRRPDWRIARRTCVWDYTYIVPAGDAWPLGPAFRRGRPDRSDPSYR